jgi:hypothetical protein
MTLLPDGASLPPEEVENSTAIVDWSAMIITLNIAADRVTMAGSKASLANDSLHPQLGAW